MKYLANIWRALYIPQHNNTLGIKMSIHKLAVSTLLLSMSLVSLVLASDNEELFSLGSRRDSAVFSRAVVEKNFSYAQQAEEEGLQMPAPDPDGRIQTLNKKGAMSPELDPTSRAFVEQAAAPSTKALEIGAAYGLACMEALKKGATSYTANDIDATHLKILARRVRDMDPNYLARLELIPGCFPEKLSLPDDYFDVMLMARVLHFMNPEQAVHTLSAAYKTLKPGGRIYAVMLSPYVRGFASFIPTFEQRIVNGDHCPGYVDNLLDIADRAIVPEGALKNMDRKPFLFFDIRTATNLFEKAGFKVVKAVETPLAYESLIWQLDGRENIGMIAQKPM